VFAAVALDSPQLARRPFRKHQGRSTLVRAPWGARVIIFHDGRPASMCPARPHLLLARRPNTTFSPAPRHPPSCQGATYILPRVPPSSPPPQPRGSDPDHRSLYSLHLAGGIPTRAYHCPTPHQPSLARSLRVDDGREPGNGAAPTLPNLHSQRASSPSLPYSRSTLCVARWRRCATLPNLCAAPSVTPHAAREHCCLGVPHREEQARGRPVHQRPASPLRAA
jgi:hypothetical protein